MASLVHRWIELSSQPMSVEAIRKLHVPAAHFRVSPNRYAVGAVFPGTGMAGRIYVLLGRCSKAVGDWRAELTAGTYADFPAGSYEFKVLGTQDVEVVNVWEIPEGYRVRSDA